MWWRTVLIGSLKLSPWKAIHENVAFHHVSSISQANPNLQLVVVESLNPLVIKGVILPAALAQSHSSDENIGQQSITQVENRMSANFKLVQVEGGIIGDVEDALKIDLVDAVLLFRSTKVLTEGQVVERKHLIGVVTKRDLKNWIAEVEGHHNITSTDATNSEERLQDQGSTI